MSTYKTFLLLFDQNNGNCVVAQCSSDMLYWTPRILSSFINNYNMIKINTFIVCIHPSYYFLIITFTENGWWCRGVVMQCNQSRSITNYISTSTVDNLIPNCFFFRFTGSFCRLRSDCIRVGAYVWCSKMSSPKSKPIAYRSYSTKTQSTKGNW
jgi:hypothetical protein